MFSSSMCSLGIPNYNETGASHLYSETFEIVPNINSDLVTFNVMSPSSVSNQSLQLVATSLTRRSATEWYVHRRLHFVTRKFYPPWFCYFQCMWLSPFILLGQFANLAKNIMSFPLQCIPKTLSRVRKLDYFFLPQKQNLHWCRLCSRTKHVSRMQAVLTAVYWTLSRRRSLWL